MKFKGFIPPGYELVKGRNGLYLRKQTEKHKASIALERNSRKLPLVNFASSAIQKGISEERKYLYDGNLYHRLKSKLMLGRALPKQWWTKDWLKGFEVHSTYKLNAVIDFESTYRFEKQQMLIELTVILQQDFTRKKGKSVKTVQLYFVLLFVNEEKGKVKRFASELLEVGKDSKKITAAIPVSPKPKWPFVLLVYASGCMDGKPIENIDATGMQVIGSGA